MGCGASTQDAGHASKDPNVTKYADDDSEGELSDEGSVCSISSETSTASNRSITRVTSTRGRMASSSTTTPKLQYRSHSSNHSSHPAHHYEHGADDALPGHASHRNKPSVGRAAAPLPPQEQFLFGDFNVDPKDVARQRVERLNRVRRPSRSFDQVPEKRKAVEVFILNDFVVNAMDDDDELPDMSAHTVAIPTGFRRLSSLKVRTLIGHTDRVKALIISRDERSILSAAITDCVVSMADMKGHELNCYPGHDAYIVALALSRDGKLFASSARDGTIGVWEYSTNREHAMKKQVRTFGADEAQNAISISLAFGFNNRHLIAGGQDGCCRVWEVDRAGISVVYERHSNVIVSVSPHPSEPIVASASGDKSIHVWRYETGEPILRLQGHDSAVISVQWTLDGRRLLSNDDRTCRLWSAETGESTLTVRLDQIVNSQRSGAGHQLSHSVNSTTKESLHVVNEGILASKTKQCDAGYLARLEAALSGPNTTAARAAQMERVTARTIFTVSALLPGPLSNSYFAVASTTGEVFIVNAVNGTAEAVIPTKAPVFAMHSGSYAHLLFGDIFGNVYVTAFK